MWFFLEKLACRFLIWRFHEGYGANCETSDLDDGTLGEKLSSEAVIHNGRCWSCRAKEAIIFLENHITL